MVSIVHCSGRTRSLHLLPQNSGASGTASRVHAYRWTYIAEKEALSVKELEHVLIEKVEQVFRNMLKA